MTNIIKHMSKNNRNNRGLASAGKEIRKKVSSKGGKSSKSSKKK